MVLVCVVLLRRVLTTLQAGLPHIDTLFLADCWAAPPPILTIILPPGLGLRVVTEHRAPGNEHSNASQHRLTCERGQAC